MEPMLQMTEKTTGKDEKRTRENMTYGKSNLLLPNQLWDTPT